MGLTAAGPKKKRCELGVSASWLKPPGHVFVPTVPCFDDVFSHQSTDPSGSLKAPWTNISISCFWPKIRSLTVGTASSLRDMKFLRKSICCNVPDQNGSFIASLYPGKSCTTSSRVPNPSRGRVNCALSLVKSVVITQLSKLRAISHLLP